MSEKFWSSWLGLCIKISPDCLQELLPCSPVSPCTVAFCRSHSPTKCDFFQLVVCSFFPSEDYLNVACFICMSQRHKVILDVNNTKLERSAGGRMNFSLLGKWLSPLLIVILPSMWGVLSTSCPCWTGSCYCATTYLCCFWFGFFFLPAVTRQAVSGCDSSASSPFLSATLHCHRGWTGTWR